MTSLFVHFYSEVGSSCIQIYKLAWLKHRAELHRKLSKHAVFLLEKGEDPDIVKTDQPTLQRRSKFVNHFIIAESSWSFHHCWIELSWFGRASADSVARVGGHHKHHLREVHFLVAFANYISFSLSAFAILPVRYTITFFCIYFLSFSIFPLFIIYCVHPWFSEWSDY